MRNIQLAERAALLRNFSMLLPGPKLLLLVFLFSLAPVDSLVGVAAAQAPSSDSADIKVVFSASQGTITSSGLYTAGSAPGTARVVASTGEVADTTTVTVRGGPTTSAATRLPPAAEGIPFGLFDAWSGSGLKAYTDIFTAMIGSTNPSNIIQRIAVARDRHLKLILTMTGGAHRNYMTDGVFDVTKWQAKMDAYKTADITAAVAAGVADGTIIGNSVMDEPHVRGLGDGNTWGPKGTMTKERVDQLCAYVKQIFPTLPVGVVHPHRAFEPDRPYRVCDFLVDQYSWRQGDVARFRDEALAQARRDGIAILFSMNILNGGVQARRDGSWNCDPAVSGGRGTYRPNCRMTPDQVRDWGQLLGIAGCGLVMWRYDETFMAQPENRRALQQVADRLKAAPANSCTRRAS